MKKGGLFKTARVIIVLGVSLLVAVFLIKLRPQAKKQERVTTGHLVEVYQTKSKAIPMSIEAYGTVTARKVLKLVAEVKGKVVDLHPNFIDGGYVKKGEPLVKIDPRTYALEVKRHKVGIRQAKTELKRINQEISNLAASIEIAELDLALAEKEIKRVSKLAGKDMTAQSVLDKAKRQHLISRERLQTLKNRMALTGPARLLVESRLDLARVMLQQAELDLERTQINAPFNAWVLEEDIEIGRHLAVGQPVGRIYNAESLDIEVSIPVSELEWFPETPVQSKGPEVEIIYNGTTPPLVFNGVAARVKAALDPSTRTLPLVIHVAMPGLQADETRFEPFSSKQLKPGMFVMVRIKGKTLENIHTLPRHMVHDGEVVYLANGNILSIQQVSVVRRFKTSVFVWGGLKDGDKVITTPLINAYTGMKIRVNHNNQP